MDFGDAKSCTKRVTNMQIKTDQRVEKRYKILYAAPFLTFMVQMFQYIKHKASILQNGKIGIIFFAKEVKFRTDLLNLQFS